MSEDIYILNIITFFDMVEVVTLLCVKFGGFLVVDGRK
jgi:hypothetical protein